MGKTPKHGFKALGARPSVPANTANGVVALVVLVVVVSVAIRQVHVPRVIRIVRVLRGRPKVLVISADFLLIFKSLVRSFTSKGFL